jgi:hypothetical protein
MFEQVFESFRQATQATLYTQQELFRKWLALWPGVPTGSLPGVEQARQFQKKWAEVVGEVFERQRKAIEAQFRAGLDSLEKAFHVGEARNVEELRTRMIELWQKCFEALRQVSELQVREFQAALEKWAELVTKPAA